MEHTGVGSNGYEAYSVDVSRNVILVVVALILSFNTANYATQWRSNFALHCYTAEMAPLKPRPWLNCGAALATWLPFPEALRARLAESAWLEARRVAQLPHTPEWDRAAAHLLVDRNLATLAKLEREGR